MNFLKSFFLFVFGENRVSISWLLRMSNKDIETYGNGLENKEERTAVVLTKFFKRGWFLFVSALVLQAS